MLPSKGYFSSIPCPFYDTGDCIRPHCHFRHSKKDKVVENQNSKTSTTTNNEESGKDDDPKVSGIKELVIETVKQVLSQTDLGEKTNDEKLTDDIVNNVVNSIEPKLESQKKEFSDVPSYKPTPISELNRRHIPVVYAPTKPGCIDRVKRKDVKESLLYMPRSLNKNSLASGDTYVPSTTNNRKTDLYVPDICTSFTYHPSQISATKVLSNSKNLAQINFFPRNSVDSENEETLRALDQLIEEEFGNSNEVSSSTPENDEGLLQNTASTNSKEATGNITLVLDVLPAECSQEVAQEQSNNSTLNKDSDSQASIVSSRKPDKLKNVEKSINSSEEKPDRKDNEHSHKHSSKKNHKHSKSSSKEDKLKHRYKNKDEKHSKSSSSSGHKDKKPKDKDSSHDKYSSNKKNSSDKYTKHDKKKKYNADELEKKDKHITSSSRHKICSKDHKLKKKCHKEKDVTELLPPKKIKLEDPKEDFNAVDSISSCSDVEEIISTEDAIVIDSSSNSSNGSCQERAESILESWSSNEPDSPPPAKRKREDNFKSLNYSPQNVLCERWRKARETVLMKTSAPGKVKIAHVPNVSSLLNAKDELIAKAKRVPDTSSQRTDVCTPIHEEYVPKPPTRKAHVPSQAMAKYPVILMEENLKVPVTIRQTCLNNLYDEYQEFLEPEIARKKAQEEELEICRRLHVTKTYQNAVALAVLRIRKNQIAISNPEKEQESNTILHSYSTPDYTYGWTLYKCFSKYLLTDEEYVSNGYPIQIASHQNCGYIEKSARRASVAQPKDSSMRICVHCSKNYFVDESGFPLEENDCYYHWGKLRKVRVCGGYSEIYICCGAEVGSEPCSSGRYHVCNLYNDDFLEGFVSTRPMKSNLSLERAGIYAIDCEMCYTTKGLALTRCTLVDINGKTVYDKIVLPDEPILDYCTRFSGMTETMMKSAKLKLKDVQRDLLKLVNEKTILVGHSLENDLKALRLFHKTLVDTSVVFPHQMGLPYKNSLKRIVKDILNISIQDKESGHDSFEDANACMQIMLWKIKEDAKGRKPRVIISLDSKGAPTFTR